MPLPPNPGLGGQPRSARLYQLRADANAIVQACQNAINDLMRLKGIADSAAKTTPTESMIRQWAATMNGYGPRVVQDADLVVTAIAAYVSDAGG